MPTIDQLLRTAMQEDCSPAEAAEKVLASPAFLDAVRPLLVWRVNVIARNVTRKAEHAFARTGRDSRGEALHLLASAYFALPDGTFVEWLDATADQHRARAGWQRGHAAACVNDAELHEQAAADIEAAGVVCLRDLEAVAV